MADACARQVDADGESTGFYRIIFVVLQKTKVIFVVMACQARMVNMHKTRGGWFLGILAPICFMVALLVVEGKNVVGVE